ncbi:hypothetical protein HIM_09873 [Hirsutella minnesotensis 3608]|uniref:ubiquitinyl hydrolase 1 n=1 Tax=Hirsutella minnesotensis 3608 TaxID=1043627 RepID=A0A0F7ZKT6_9HYPO|nr:hypothetical protein HIM_09873 [Hirsutella minnesotensis 3608]
MNSERSEFASYYEDRVSAHRLAYPRNSFWDRWNEPSILLSVLALLVTLALKFYGSDGALQEIFGSFGTILWDSIVFLIPARLIFALDRRVDSASASERAAAAESPSIHAAKSEAMCRIIGLDRPGGVLASMSKARTRAFSVTGSVLGLKLDFQRPPGLGNRDNSCYQNSILQGLAALDSFPEYLSACVRAVDTHQQDSSVAQTLRTLICDLNDSSNNGKTIWTPTLLKSMSTWTQQDAQEYYSKMLDDIDKSVAKAIKEARRYSGFEPDCSKDESASSQHSEDSGYQSLSPSPDLSAIKPLRSPLEGLLAQRVACVQCGYAEGLSMIPFNCLTLSLGLDKNRHDLYERLDAYSRVESIEGVECPKCTLLKAQRLLLKLIERLQDNGAGPDQLSEPRRRLESVEMALEEDWFDEKTMTDKCKISNQGKVSSTKTKQIVIARPPQSLAIHVNRSVFDPTTFDMMKNSAPVSFPLTLDLGPWCLGSSDGSMGDAEKMNGAKDAGEEQWQLNPTASMIAGDLRPSRLTGPIYELRAVVTHAGRHENGHYICYRKYPNRTRKSQNGVLSDAGTPTSKADDGIDDDELTEKQDSPSETTNMSTTGWWRLSDHNVSRTDEGTILGLSPGVFMLFYECVDASMMLQSEVECSLDADQLLWAAHILDKGANNAGDAAGNEAEEQSESNAGDAPLPTCDDDIATTVADS